MSYRAADGLAALVPAAGWQRLSCADGSKGLRLYAAKSARPTPAEAGCLRPVDNVSPRPEHTPRRQRRRITTCSRAPDSSKAEACVPGRRVRARAALRVRPLQALPPGPPGIKR
jgi:hypothetical protein